MPKELYESEFQGLGNLPQGYILNQKIVKSLGWFICPELILKSYSIAEKKHPDNRKVQQTFKLLEDKIREKEIAPLIGLGFAILSEEMLNVAIWDNQYPIVLKNKIYALKEGQDKGKILSPDDIGSFCIWELGIVDHEKDAWKKYLTSTREGKDKINYLTDFFKGRL